MATYRIGPTDFFTGADLQADAQTLESQVEALDGQVNGNTAPSPDLVTSWVLFEAQWEAWYNSTFVGAGNIKNFLTALNDGNRDQLIQYEQRFADLASQFAGAGVTSAGVDVSVSSGAGDTVSSLISQLDAAAKKLLPFGLGLGAFIVIALAVWYFVLPTLAVSRG
jgi:hypothetical protein